MKSSLCGIVPCTINWIRLNKRDGLNKRDTLCKPLITPVFGTSQKAENWIRKTLMIKHAHLLVFEPKQSDSRRRVQTLWAIENLSQCTRVRGPAKARISISTDSTMLHISAGSYSLKAHESLRERTRNAKSELEFEANLFCLTRCTLWLRSSKYSLPRARQHMMQQNRDNSLMIAAACSRMHPTAEANSTNDGCSTSEFCQGKPNIEGFNKASRRSRQKRTISILHDPIES